MRAATLFVVLTVGLRLAGATYVVPSDVEMIQRSDDIVVATALGSHAERTSRGGIVTRAVLRVEHVLKGNTRAGEELVLTELGGSVAGISLIVPGAPRYVPGQRYLVFTETNRAGETITYGMALGQFALTPQGGRIVAARSGISGFDRNLEVHLERVRDAAMFAQYIRGIVAREQSLAPSYFVDVPPESERVVTAASAFSRTSYLLEGAYRWQNAPNADFVIAGTVPASLDGPASVAQAIAAWNDTDSNIDYSVAGFDPTATGGLVTPDGRDGVLFGDPNGEVPADVAATGGAWGSDGTYHDEHGETFVAIVEADVVVNDTFAGKQNCLSSVMTHEIGHTLGLRHSNQNGSSNGPCVPATQDCTSDAIMNAVVSCAKNGRLETWDRDAAATVYGDGVPCEAPSITTQPADESIVAGDSVAIEVTALGTGLSYQWYAGESGDTSQPTGGNSARLNVAPAATTSYWVRVSGRCGSPADSASATVTVGPCPDVVLGALTATRNPDGSFTLTIPAASGSQSLRYAWFRGATPGEGGTPVGSSRTLTVTVGEPTSFWVKVTNRCGNSAVSRAFTLSTGRRSRAVRH